MQDDFGLDWGVYPAFCGNYGARFYDAQIGRFHTHDRFAEKYHSWTPYQYGGNNPISFIDINGDSIWYGNPMGIVTHSEIGARNYAGTHTLYALNDKDERGASVSIKDGSILDQLATDRDNKKGSNPIAAIFFPDGVSYAVTTNKKEAFEILFFVAVTAKSKAEWKLDGYITNGKKEYVLATGHSETGAPSTFTDRMAERDVYNLNFSIHTHPAHISRGGGSWSGDWDAYDWIRNNALSGRAEPGMHYVLEVQDRTLYNYKGRAEGINIPIRQIRKASDLHRHLGF
jgi:hypothetical protein